MKLRNDERARVNRMVRAAILVMYEERSTNWLSAVGFLDREATRNIVTFGLRGKHVNSLAWRVARRFGKAA